MKSWPIILTAGLLAGCAHFESRPLAPEQSAAQLDARRLDDAGLARFVATNCPDAAPHWPPARWNLNSLTLVAFYFHPDLAVARAQWRLADSGVKTAGGRPNPTVTVGPGYNFSAAAGLNPWMPFGSLDLPLETAGKRGKRLAEAGHLAESARWNYVLTAWQIRSGVRTALLELDLAQSRAQLLQKQFETQNEIAQRLWQRYEAGALARSETVPAQMALNKTRLDLASAQAKLSESRSRLAEALGLPPVALAGLPFQCDWGTHDLAGLRLTEARPAALLGRADIRAALADYAAAEDNLRLEIAKQYPDLHLNPGYQFDQGDHKWTIGFTFELPVLNQNQGPIAESRARRALAEAKFLQLQAQVIATIDRATANLDAARQQVNSGRELLALAERQQQSVAAQVQAGAAEPLDQLNAELELNTVRLAQLDGEAQLQTALGALEDAVQHPVDDFAAVKFLPVKSQP